MSSRSQRSRWLLVLSLLCLVTATLLSCFAQEAPALYPVRGTVVNSLTREPIARALVESNGDGVLTDGNGHFEFNLPPGGAQLSVRRPGYVRGSTESHIVEVAADLPQITLALTPEAVLAGHVVLPDGEDADEVNITLFRQRMTHGHHAWEMRQTIRSNSDGIFRITNLDAPGTYLLVTAPQFDSQGDRPSHKSVFGYGAAYYPEGAETAATSSLTLVPGQQAHMDLGLTRQQFYSVTLQVKNEPAPPDVSVEIRDEAGLVTDLPTQWSEQKKSAQAWLPAGRYYAVFRAQGHTPLYGRVDFTVTGAPVTILSAVMLPLHPVPVEVHKDFVSVNNSGDASVLSIEGASPAPQMNLGLNLQLTPADTSIGNGGFLRSSSTDPSLAQIDGAVPGSYWIKVYPFEGYVSSITSGGVDLAAEPLVLGPGNSSPPIEITLRNDGAHITGTIGRPSGGNTYIGTPGMVIAVPQFPSTMQAPQAGVESSGDFNIANVAPGSYRVIAVDQYVDVDSMEPQEFAKYLSAGQSVTVEANGSASVTLQGVSSRSGSGAVATETTP